MRVTIRQGVRDTQPCSSASQVISEDAAQICLTHRIPQSYSESKSQSLWHGLVVRVRLGGTVTVRQTVMTIVYKPRPGRELELNF